MHELRNVGLERTQTGVYRSDKGTDPYVSSMLMNRFGQLRNEEMRSSKIKILTADAINVKERSGRQPRNYDHILLPINLPEYFHWVLASLNLLKHNATFYDSCSKGSHFVDAKSKVEAFMSIWPRAHPVSLDWIEIVHFSLTFHGPCISQSMNRTVWSSATASIVAVS